MARNVFQQIPKCFWESWELGSTKAIISKTMVMFTQAKVGAERWGSCKHLEVVGVAFLQNFRHEVFYLYSKLPELSYLSFNWLNPFHWQSYNSYLFKVLFDELKCYNLEVACRLNWPFVCPKSGGGALGTPRGMFTPRPSRTPPPWSSCAVSGLEWRVTPLTPKVSVVLNFPD